MSKTWTQENTKKLTMAGLMAAITVIMVYTPIGMIPLPGLSLTISHIPTIISAILFGPAVGCAVGIVFGAASLVRALTWPQGILDPLFINPLVSVLPRALIGLSTYFVYKLLADRKAVSAGLLLGAAVGSMTNTIGCLGMIYILYAKDVVEKMASINMETTAEGFVLFAIYTSGLTEMAAAAIITYPLVKALNQVVNK